MKRLFKWWIALEAAKAAIIIFPLFHGVEPIYLSIATVAFILLTLINYREIFPLIRKIMKLISEAKIYTNTELLSRAKLNLCLIMLWDLVPFIPAIQGILRLLYYRKFDRPVTQEIEVEEYLSK